MIKKRIRVDEFRIKEENGIYVIQQKIHIVKKNIFGRVKKKYKKWEVIFDDCILYLNGETIGFGNFKSIEQAKEGIKHYREISGFLEKEIKYHY